jgi:hypothetical protein
VDGRHDPHGPRGAPSKEGRDAHMNFGIEAGVQDAMDLLEQVAISLR